MNFKDKRDQLLAELGGDKDYGVLLAVQMGGVPEELQLIIQTAVLDEAAGGLRPRGQYVVRALGVFEHQAHLGMFGALHLIDDHPLLFQYNHPPVALFFRGKPASAHELLVDLQQAHVSLMGFWRLFTDYLELEQPLIDLLGSGGGLLGRMPRPLGEALAKVFEHHQVETKLIEGTLHDDDDDDDQRSRAGRLLLIDQSYFIALDFTVDELGKV